MAGNYIDPQTYRKILEIREQIPRYDSQIAICREQIREIRARLNPKQDGYFVLFSPRVNEGERTTLQDRLTSLGADLVRLQDERLALYKALPEPPPSKKPIDTPLPYDNSRGSSDSRNNGEWGLGKTILGGHLLGFW